MYGNSNRESNPIYSKAGILKEIVYPTKGNTSFEYEGNTAIAPYLPNATIEQFITLDSTSNNPQVIVETFNPDTMKIPINVTTMIHQDGCIPIVQFTNSITGDVFTLQISQQLSAMKYGASILLEKGIYNVSFQVIKENTNTSCPAYFFDIRWSNEIDMPTKNVGGLRIKSITNNFNESGSGKIKKEFTYINDDNESSGSIIHSPIYHTQKMLEYDAGPYTLNSPFTPFTLHFSASPILSLSNSFGSDVGYSKVTEQTNTIIGNIKTEYYYTSTVCIRIVADFGSRFFKFTTNVVANYNVHIYYYFGYYFYTLLCFRTFFTFCF